MRKQTNINELRTLAISFLHVEPEPINSLLLHVYMSADVLLDRLIKQNEPVEVFEIDDI